MTNLVSLADFKRFEAHRARLNMDVLKARVEAMKLANKPKDTHLNEEVQDKTKVLER